MTIFKVVWNVFEADVMPRLLWPLCNLTRFATRHRTDATYRKQEPLKLEKLLEHTVCHRESEEQGIEQEC